MQHAVLLQPGHCNGVASIQEWFSSAVKHRWPVIASDLSDLAPWILITLLGQQDESRSWYSDFDGTAGISCCRSL